MRGTVISGFSSWCFLKTAFSGLTVWSTWNQLTCVIIFLIADNTFKHLSGWIRILYMWKYYGKSCLFQLFDWNTIFSFFSISKFYSWKRRCDSVLWNVLQLFEIVLTTLLSKSFVWFWRIRGKIIMILRNSKFPKIFNSVLFINYLV